LDITVTIIITAIITTNTGWVATATITTITITIIIIIQEVLHRPATLTEEHPPSILPETTIQVPPGPDPLR
jgi:hypothetical protein